VLRSQLVLHGPNNEDVVMDQLEQDEGSVANNFYSLLMLHHLNRLHSIIDHLWIFFHVEELGLHDQEKKTRKGRKRTRMHTVYDRGNKPPVPVSFNEKGQPDGDNASEFSNFIATLVKTHMPLKHEDWRLVDVKKKNELLSTLRVWFSCCSVYFASLYVVV
jgi:hypothetical protein